MGPDEPLEHFKPLLGLLVWFPLGVFFLFDFNNSSAVVANDTGVSFRRCSNNNISLGLLINFANGLGYFR